jgi:glycerol uptake facilitator-like aquaporin
MFTINRLSLVAAEFLGAAIWTMVALVMSETTAVAYFIGTSVAVALAVSYLIFNTVSGPHFNPAISFGMWTARRISTLRAIAFIVAQLLGGLASWQLYQYLTNHTLPAKHGTFTGSVLIAEIIGTAVLSLGFGAAAYKLLDSLQSALAVGAALFTGILIASTASSAYLNPAVALGLRSFSAAYILGPLVGGLIGINLYNWLFMGAMPMRRTVAARSVTAPDTPATRTTRTSRATPATGSRGGRTRR